MKIMLKIHKKITFNYADASAGRMHLEPSKNKKKKAENTLKMKKNRKKRKKK